MYHVPGTLSHRDSVRGSLRRGREWERKGTYPAACKFAYTVHDKCVMCGDYAISLLDSL